MLEQYGFMVRECSNKIGSAEQYLRLAVQTKEPVDLSSVSLSSISETGIFEISRATGDSDGLRKGQHTRISFHGFFSRMGSALKTFHKLIGPITSSALSASISSGFPNSENEMFSRDFTFMRVESSA